MIDKEILQMELDKSTKELIKIINEFPDKDFNTRISENAWSTGEVLEHIIRLDGFMIKLLEGESKPTKRNPEDKLEFIKRGFLDIEKKYNAPKFFIPRENNQNKNDCLENIIVNRKKISELVIQSNLSGTYPDIIHPVFGEMSSVEWIYSIIYHSERHMIQIKRIKDNLIND
jgi:hypothetical protein